MRGSLQGSACRGRVRGRSRVLRARLMVGLRVCCCIRVKHFLGVVGTSPVALQHT